MRHLSSFISPVVFVLARRSSGFKATRMRFILQKCRRKCMRYQYEKRCQWLIFTIAWAWNEQKQWIGKIISSKCTTKLLQEILRSHVHISFWCYSRTQKVLNDEYFWQTNCINKHLTPCLYSFFVFEWCTYFLRI